MKRRELIILRHAKSAWDNEAPADFDRPLALRGLRASKRMGRYIAETGLIPDAVVCSTATRAVQTLLGVAQVARFTLRPVRFEGAIYEAGPLGPSRRAGRLRPASAPHDDCRTQSGA